MARVTPLPGSLHFNPIRASKISTTKSHRLSCCPVSWSWTCPRNTTHTLHPLLLPTLFQKDTCFSPGILCLSAVVHGILETHATSALRRVGMKRGYNSVILLFSVFCTHQDLENMYDILSAHYIRIHIHIFWRIPHLCGCPYAWRRDRHHTTVPYLLFHDVNYVAKWKIYKEIDGYTFRQKRCMVSRVYFNQHLFFSHHHMST